MHIGVILLVFGVIFISELPDKSMFASLVLGTRYPGFYVWLGTAAAFLVHVLIAVTAGHALTLLPHRTVEFIVTALFLAGALLLFFGKHGLEPEEVPEHMAEKAPKGPSSLRAFTTAFSVIFIGEWGDITQIATANYTAKYHDALSVGLGATLGLWLAALLAIAAGSRILKYVPGKVLQRVAGVALLIFAIISFRAAIVG